MTSINELYNIVNDIEPLQYLITSVSNIVDIIVNRYRYNKWCKNNDNVTPLIITESKPINESKLITESKLINESKPITESKLLQKINTILSKNKQLIWEYIKQEVKNNILFELETDFLKKVLESVLPKIKFIKTAHLIQYINNGSLLIYKENFTEIYYNITQKDQIWEWGFEYDILFVLYSLLHNSKNIGDPDLKHSRHIIHSLYYITIQL